MTTRYQRYISIGCALLCVGLLLTTNALSTVTHVVGGVMLVASAAVNGMAIRVRRDENRGGGCPSGHR